MNSISQFNVFVLKLLAFETSLSISILAFDLTIQLVKISMNLVLVLELIKLYDKIFINKFLKFSFKEKILNILD